MGKRFSRVLAYNSLAEESNAQLATRKRNGTYETKLESGKLWASRAIRKGMQFVLEQAVPDHIQMMHSTRVQYAYRYYTVEEA